MTTNKKHIDVQFTPAFQRLIETLKTFDIPGILVKVEFIFEVERISLMRYTHEVREDGDWVIKTGQVELTVPA